MRNILITGATGRIGRQLIDIILRNSDDFIFAIVRKQSEESWMDSPRIKQISVQSFFGPEPSWSFDLLIHLAFARAARGPQAIAESLEFTERLFARAMAFGIPKVIYISSQGVYGNTSEIRSIESSIAPLSVYSMAKYSGELLLQESMAPGNSSFNILRLDNVIESQNLIHALCEGAIRDKRISLKGGGQVFSYIHAYDAARAIFLSYTNSLKKNSIYNVGPNRMRVGLREIGEMIRRISKERGNPIDVDFQEDATELWAGMDSEEFIRDTGWAASKSIYEMITDIYIQTERKLLEG